MDNIDLQVLGTVRDWRAAGHRVVLATVARTWGSAPRPVGSLVAVRGDGRISGSVSGGCIEDELIDAVRGARVAVERPQILRYGAAGEATRPLGLPCGGTIELVLETVTAASAIDALLERLARGERVQRSLRLTDGSVTLAAAGPGDALRLDAEQLVTTHGPSYRLLLIGAGQLSQYLAGMALTLGYEVLVCDPREAYAGGLGRARRAAAGRHARRCGEPDRARRPHRRHRAEPRRQA